MRKKVIFIIIIIPFILLNTIPLVAESDIYDRIGIIPEHGLHGAVPEENIDLFTGNLTLRFLDIHLPGPNGLDLEIWRVYNSKIVKDNIPPNVPDYNQDHRSWVGFGWSLHMGRVHYYNSDEPIVEFPDGRMETAYPDETGKIRNTRSFLKYDRNESKLYFKDGTIWTCGDTSYIYLGGEAVPIRMVTEIESSFGHKITIQYRSNEPIMEKIIDSLGREVIFITDDTSPSHPKLDKIRVKNADGQFVDFDYTVGEFSTPINCFKLISYKPPEIPAATYEYYTDEGMEHYQLKAVNTSFGGRMEYEYEDHEFNFVSYTLRTRVVKTKRIKFFSSDSYKTWIYTYPSYQDATGTVTVDGPVFDTKATYYGFPDSDPYENGWRIGLLKEKWFTDNSYSEEQEWTYFKISDNEWEVLNQNLGKIKAPLLSKSIITRNGDAESTEEYLYERTDVKQYGLPTKIKYYGGATGTTLKNYKTLEYFFESNGTYEDRYLISFISNEAIYKSTGTKLKETQTKYCTDSPSKYGAIDEIKKLKSGAYSTWDYTYSCTYPRDITITINLPGNGGIETYKYSYGVLSKIMRPTYTELSRSISQYNSAILSETNQHDGTMSFTYDDLNRVKIIETPSDFNNITAGWSTNSVTITQGGNSVVKYWDGMGRDTGYEESGDLINLYFRRTLDAEGRVTAENKGSTSTSHQYSYQRNAVGNITKITDPRGKITNITYSGDQKTVTDAEGHATVFYYEGIPGLATKLKDPMNRYAYYTYDDIGRLTQVNYNNARTQTYAYDGLDHVTSESHPETGSITYSYNSSNNLEWRLWDNKYINYQYNTSNQLTEINTGSGYETIDYIYDIQGRVKKVSSTNGWFRDNIYYNEFGSITEERQYIPGPGYFTLDYTYDRNNNLDSITYPDNKKVDISNNSLNMPETISFSGKSIISQVAYGINKQPTSMGISGNGTTFSAAYEANGLLSTTSLKKGSSVYYRANYGYDDVGNITSITNTVPSLNAGFGYDALYRLTSASYTGGKSYIYTYDYYGNLTTAKENGSTVFNTSYTTKNQINNSSFDYDNRGNLIKAPGFEYEWDRQNQLSAVKLDTDTGETASTHMYNERGLRLKSSRLPAPSITIISPSAGETWHKNGTYSITWTKTGIMDDYVRILLYQGDIQVLEMTSSTENDGTYEWLIPLTLSPGQYWIAVQTVDGRVTGSSANFVISEAVVVTVTSPNGGETWAEGSSHEITWTSTGTVGDVKIEYSIDNGTAWTEIIASTPNDGSYNWTLPETPSVNCLVRISETDGYPSDVSDAVFSICSTITVTAPNGGEYWQTGTYYDITWTSTASVGNVRIDYSTDNGSSWSFIVTSILNTGSYSWRVYDTPSDQCLMRVSETDGDPSDVSDAVFSIVPPPDITVTSPNGGETWEVGSNYNITWTHIGIVGDVKIEYTTDNGTSWSTIAASTANDGSYSWTIPETPSQNCRVRVSEVDGTPSDVSNNVFTIVLIPKITVTAPNGGENLEVGSTYNITWTSVGVVGNVKIDYSFNSGTSWTTINASTANDGSYSWSIPDTVSNNCLVRVSELDGDPLDVSDNVFSIVPPPSITVTSPNGGENWQVVTSHNITWTYEGIVGNVKIEYTTNNGSSWATIVTSTANDGLYNWTIPETPSANCRVRVSETDGSPSDVSDAVFSIVLPPSLTITSPNGGETWEKNATHAVTWTSTGIVDDVEIEYSIDNGTTWSTIIAATANDGSYDWTVPDTPSEGCLVRISETDGDPTDTSDAIFSIVDELEPGITVTAPNGGEIWEINSNRDITWTSTGDVGNVKIEYSTNTGTSWTTIVTSTANDGTYNWLVPANPSENCLIRVSETDGSPIDASDAVFSIISETSPCGKSWSMSGYSGTDIFKSTAYGNALFASVGTGGVIWTSPDGITWTSQSSGTTNDLNGVVYGNNTFVAVGNSGVILTSPNGTNWTSQSSGASNDLYGITYGGSTFAAVGAGGVILTSSDGITWTPRSSNVTHNLNGVGYGNNTFAAVGDSGVILTSPNGTIWTTQTSNTSRDLRGITYGSGGGIFVAVGNSGVILTSPDGIDWNSRTSIVSTSLLGAAYGSNKYVIVGQDGEILTSLDGIGWTAQSSGVSHHLYGVVYDNARFVAAGEEVILYSLCGASSPSLTITSPNGGENVIAGTNLTITWASTGAVGNVKIDYSTDSGTSWTEITASYPNNGSYDWTVPDTPSTHCLVRISETDGSPADVSDSEFTILPPSSATITITSPNGGEILLADSIHEITWTFTGTIDNVFIEYSFNNGVTWKTIVLSTPNSGSYNWSVPAAPSDECLVRIGNSDAADGEPSDTSDALFSIELSNSITVTSPNGGESWEMGSTQTITWTSTGAVGPVKIEYSIDRGSTWTGIVAPTENDGSYEWTIPDMPDTPLNDCLVRISEHDVDKGPSDVSNEAFSIISPLSTFIKVTAPNGGERLAIGSTYTITWTSTATIGDVKIDYSTDNGFSWTEIAAATENDGQYDWLVPDTLSDTCLVQVSKIDGDPTDVSDAVFSIVTPSTITVTSPNGGESWEAGTSQDITWTSTGTVGNIKIEYSIDSGTSWTGIVNSTANSGIYQWIVPDTPSDTCLVRISESDIDGGPSDISDSVFSITPPSAPAIMVTFPNGGEALTVGSIYEITWTTVGTVGDLKIEYSTDNGTSWTEIITVTENDGNYEWTVPDDPSDNCLIRVSEADDGDPSDVSDAVFSIVPISSTLTVTSPNGGEILTAGSTHEITWTSTGTINNVVIEYSIDSGASWTTIVTSTTNDGSYDWTIPDTPSTISDHCLVKICMDDEDRNPFDISDAEFSIVSSSPESVTVTSPNGGEGLLIGSTHEITWTSTGTIDYVRIEYSTDNGGKWINIITSTTNDGSYNWIIPSVPDDPSNECLVRISENDEDGNVSDVSDAVFSITSDTSECGESWLNTDYSGSETFTGVTYGSSQFAAVGNSGKIMTSANGITWTSKASGITNDLYGIVYEEAVNRFAAVGAGGVILTSSDGITWETQTSGITTGLRGIAYGAGTFAAVGIGGVVLTSPDGITWNIQSSGITYNLYGIVYGDADNTFAAVGESGVILTSPNGTNWTTQSSGTSKTLRGITYGGDAFLAVGASGAILTSPNGLTWNSRTSSITTNFKSAAYGNNTFVIIGNDGKIVTSNDRIVWTNRSSGVRNDLRGIVFNDSKFVAVGTQTIIYSLCQEQGAGGQNTRSHLMEKYGLDHLPGDNESETRDQKTLLRLVSPNGDEILNAGENFLITWESEKFIENIKLEYSPDNGSAYLTIKDRIPNTGYYEWQVPHHISSNCLVRVSNSDGVKREQNILLYELKFKINSLTFSPIFRKDFSFWLGDMTTQNLSIPEISIIQESNGKEYIYFEENIKEIGISREFHNCWHSLKVLMDQINNKISIIMDGQPVFENFSLLQGHKFIAAVSMSTNPCDTTDVEIDDFIVRVLNSIDKKNQFVTLFKEDFEKFEDGRFPKNSGWVSKGIINQEKDFSKDIVDSISVQSDSINGNKSLKINNSDRNKFIVVKHFNIPENFPFDISDRPFEIRYNEDMEIEKQISKELTLSKHRPVDSNNHSTSSILTSTLTLKHENSHGPNIGSYFGSPNSTAGFGTIQSTSMVDTYYIYSFDGKLMAEYDHDGNCIRDYIYMGNRLIAEYKPNDHIPEKGEEYFYYMTDQITSTRIVTDDSGNVVYSEAYGPFGGVQKNWTKAYDPKLKFSGKEREAYGDLDYFGARYYDHNSYRFISTDPIINREEALSNPQLWNLYSYCRNNPITYLDPDGRQFTGVYPPHLIKKTIFIEQSLDGGQPYLDMYLKAQEIEEKILNTAAIVMNTAQGIASSIFKEGWKGLMQEMAKLSAKKGSKLIFEQMKRLGKGEIKKLKDAGIDIHELKGGGKISRADLFKNKKGEIFVKPKSGEGPGDPTGLNIKDF